MAYSNRTVRCLIKLLIVLLEYIDLFLFDKARILAWHKYSSHHASTMLNAFRHLLCSKLCWHSWWVSLNNHAVKMHMSASVQFYSKVQYVIIMQTYWISTHRYNRQNKIYHMFFILYSIATYLAGHLHACGQVRSIFINNSLAAAASANFLVQHINDIA